MSNRWLAFQSWVFLIAGLCTVFGSHNFTDALLLIIASLITDLIIAIKENRT